MKQAIITRPIYDARIFATQCHDAGIMAIISPMINITPIKPCEDNIGTCDAIIFTSANGVRQYETYKRTNDMQIPIFVVGERTRDEAYCHGYHNIITAHGDVDSLANIINNYYQNQKARIIHPAGEDVAGDLQAQLNNAHISYQRFICYKATATHHINHYLRTYLKQHTGLHVCFFSKRTAMIFFRLHQQVQCDIDMNEHHFICLSQAIADYCADFSHKSIKIANKTEEMINSILLT